MARASCKRGSFETSTIYTLGVMLLIADGWKIVAGDPVVLGFIFGAGSPRGDETNCDAIQLLSTCSLLSCEL